MKMRKILAVLLAAVMVATMFTGCGSKKEETAKELQDFNIILDWYPNAIHSFLYNAQEKGYFAEAGLNVTMTAPASYSDGLTFPAAGKASAGFYYMDEVIEGYADQDMDIEIIGAVNQASLGVMLSLEENHVTSPADFKGKKIGYTDSEVMKKKLINMAEQNGVKEDEFELVDVGFDIESSLTTGAVDAVAGGMINNEAVELRNAGYNVVPWRLEDFGVPSEYDLLVVVNKTDFEKNPELYKGFLAACQKSFEEVKADKKAALDLLFEKEGEEYALKRDMEDESLDVIIGIEEESGEKFLTMKKERWTEVIDWLLENDLLKNKVDADEFVYFGE